MQRLLNVIAILGGLATVSLIGWMARAVIILRTS